VDALMPLGNFFTPSMIPIHRRREYGTTPIHRQDMARGR
jgi:hypothetical protein